VDRIRWTIVLTALMSLLNLPAAFMSGSDAGPAGSGVVGTAIGVLGVVAMVALVRRTPGDRFIALAVGLLNVATGVWVVAAGFGNGVVGVVLGAAITALATTLASARSTMQEAGS
jgi:hypothetical protein